jgi:hypothetical protein
MFEKKMIVFWMLVAGSISLIHGCQKQSQDLPPQAEAALHYYLNVECLVGEKTRKPFSDLLKIEKALDATGKKALKTRLEKLLTEGPDKTTEAKIKRVAKEEFAQEQAFLKENQATVGFKQEDLKIIQAETQNEYVADNLQRVRRRHKGRAGIALTVIDPKAAADALRRLDETERAELENVVRAALSHQPRKPKPPGAGVSR